MTWLLLAVLIGQAQPIAVEAPVVNEALAAQIMLDRAGFSPGEIDGRNGPNLRRAVAAFQRVHALPPTGRLDSETWAALTNRAAGAQPLVTYEISDEDVAGPFVETIPGDLMAQSALETLGYRSPLEALAEKGLLRFESDPHAAANTGKEFERRVADQLAR